MTSPQHLQSLLSRVEAAQGEDRKLFSDVFAALLPTIFGPHQRLEIDSPEWIFRNLVGGFLNAQAWESAALSLCERVLPEAYVGMQQNRWGEGGGGGAENDRSWSAYVNTFAGWQNTDNNYEFSARSKTPALALLCAILRALIEVEVKGDQDSSVAESRLSLRGDSTEAEGL
jgi:hypothetical protein